ncbi:purine-binding chemotaxis protein CheW [Phormidium tenue FACHB-886]|nr:purine-binding chemotaxis protein CheW [Phormidium tenue FACHB-886]
MTSSAIAPASSLHKAGETYLKFHLSRQIPAVLSMRYIQEAMILPSRRLTPMPNVPAPMMGLMNRRSRVIWVVDLAQLLGLAVFDAASSQQYTLILIQVGSVPLGLAVYQVEGIMRLEADTIQSPVGQVSTTLLPYLRGCVLQQQTKEVLLVLDAEAIAQSPVLQTRNS